MTLPQDIRPIFQNIQDTLSRSDLPWIERTPKSFTKVLWVGRESGSWAALNLWKAGFVLSPHKHLAGAHLFVVSGRLQVRGGVLSQNDYCYEPAGILHEATTALQDTVFLAITLGPILYFDEDRFTAVQDWEAMEELRMDHYGHQG
jgi:2,4'-dihydroxyacetophenone dioxygenase